MENASEVIKNQNSDLFSDGETIFAKSIRKSKLNNQRNLILEICPSLRKKFIRNKIKIYWSTSSCNDFINLIRCFKCSKFYHTASVLVV